MLQLKDLKRQLQQERKRAEKLQERLQELLSDEKKGASRSANRPAGDKKKSAVSFLGVMGNRSQKQLMRSEEVGASTQRENFGLTNH